MTDSTGSPTLLPLTAAQQGIWNAQKLDPTSPYYVVGEVLELGPVDTGLLARAVALTVDESETLRLRFVDGADGAEEAADGPRQYVDHTPAELPEIRDISGAPDPKLLATAIIDAEKVECGSAWCGIATDASTPLHRFLILDLGDVVWCIQLYHHIIVDGYSAALLTRRTAAHYTELAGGRKARRAKFATMAEIVASDLEYRDSDAYGEDRDFWRDHLTPTPDTTGREDLVHGAGTPSITTSLRLDREEMAELRTRAESHGLVWSDMVLGAYGAWLRKLGVTGENPASEDGAPSAEALIAMPMMARTTGPLRRTPAMQVNMVPVRFPLDSEATVPEIADTAHAALEQVRSHQRYPGSDLVRDLSRDPEVGLNGPAVLHGIGVNLKTFDFSLDFHGTSGVLRNIAGGPPEDLVLVVTPTTGGAGEAIDLAFETDPTSVDAATATQRLEDIRALLFAEGPVSQIRLRDETTLATWAAERAGAPLPDTVPTLDELIDSLTGNVADESTTLSADELSRRVKDGAARIAESCPVRAVIALDLPKGVDLAAAVLATWRAHRAFVVLDREHPEARRQHILADSGAVAVLTEDGITATGADAGAASHPQRPDAELAYLLYTSGTTGTPKGVEVTRTGVEALLAGHFQELYPSASVSAAVSSERSPLQVAHTASFSFDAAIDQLAWVFTGATVHLYSHSTVGDPEQMRSALLRDRVDVLDATPSLAGALIDSGALDATDVSTLILGGESVPQSLWDRLAANERVAAWNVYGPTEATVDALDTRIAPGPVTIGRAVPGMTAEILDVDGEVVPPNEVGELVLSGPQVALGYRGRPDAAAFEIVDNAGSAGGTRRRYRTGDRVRWRADVAATEFLGRADNQLEIRGHRVELGEVEASLLALPQVTGAAVGTFGPSGAVKLIAHVTLTPEAAAQRPAFDVRQALAAHVPGHLVPTAVRVHDRLPLTVGGKVDRRALDALAAQDDTAASDHDTSAEQDLTATERQLAEVVAELLGDDSAADTVNIEADFISLGGDSIGALTVAGRLRQLGVGIQAGDLLSGSSLRDIADGAEEVTATGGESLLYTTSSTTSADSGATGVATGPHALARTAPGQRPVLVSTIALDTTADTELDRTLTSTISALTTRHGDLRAVLDRSDRKRDEPRMIVPRVPLVDPSDLVVDLESDESTSAELADRFAGHLDPAAGVTWCVGVRHGAECTDLVVAVDPLLRSPAGVTKLLDELAAALNGQVVAQVDGGLGRNVTVHDTEAVLDLLPESFNADALAVPAAAALLATNGPVAVWLPADGKNPGGEVLTLPLLDQDTRTATDRARRALLHTKEHLVNRADAADRDDAPALTIAIVPGADTLTPASGTDALFLDMSTGRAVLHGALPENTTDDLEAALTDAFTELAVLARTSDGGASPADLTHRADQATIDVWEASYGPLADVLPVAPLQEGLLYHAADGGDGYVLAAGIDLHGRVDADRLHASLVQVLDRHDLLRARFDTSTLDEPVQVIPRTVDLPWRTVDLTSLPSEDALASAEVRLHEMASRPMDIEHLARGPLVAAELVLLPDDRAWLVLGNHHLVTDGWSTPVMLRDLLSFYHGDPLPDAAPYSDYLDWLGRRDARVDEDAWSELLDGLEHGTLVGKIAPPPADTADDGTDDAPQSGESLLEVTSGEDTDGPVSPSALLSRAAEAGVTPNTLLQAAWSLSLASLTGDSDVLFGTTVSGRPTELPGIGNTVGLFINTVPARVTVDKDQDLNGLLSTIGRTQARMTAHDATPLVRIEQLAGCGPLFDSLVVHDNFPAADTSDEADPDTISVGEIHTDGRTDFPVSVVSPPGNTFRIVLAYRPDLVDPEFIDLAHRTLVQVLESFVADPATNVGAVLDALPGRWASSETPQQDAPATSTESSAPEGTPAAPAAASGASSETAETIAEVMADLLDRRPVGVHENFFDIGGHSLLAMRLLGRLRRAGLEKVTIQDIVESGSPASLATRLDGGGTQSVLPLSPGTGPPLFCVHPGGGLALPFQGLADRLADRLDESGPLVGLQLPSPLPQAATLDELAAPYADQVQQVQEHGPYRLLGYSFGGALAHAMTAELQRRGETVSYLGVMDAYPAGESPDLPAADEAPDPADDDLAAMGGIGDDEVTEMITGNLRYCDQLLRTATPVDTNGFDGTVQVIVASRAGQGAAPATWDPVPAWSTTLGREPESLTLDTDHAGLVSDDGWDSIAPFIGRALTGQDAPSPSQEILI